MPRLGTPGEKFRDKAVIEQLPKQDLALAYCRFVDAVHHSSYEDFVSARNEIALDVAYVQESVKRTTVWLLFICCANFTCGNIISSWCGKNNLSLGQSFKIFIN